MIDYNHLTLQDISWRRFNNAAEIMIRRGQRILVIREYLVDRQQRGRKKAASMPTWASSRDCERLAER